SSAAHAAPRVAIGRRTERRDERASARPASRGPPVMTRILLVEDEPHLARSLRVGLTDESYVVDVAEDGEEALWFAASGHHDAILLDLRLPGLGGLEVCRRLRARG